MWQTSLSILITLTGGGGIIVLASPPVITEQPQDVRVDRGSPVTLRCGVYGEPVPTVTWYKDGEKVLTGAGDHTVLLPGGSLFFLRTLHNHRSRDSGVYTCRAENQDGTVYSRPATLTVTYLKHEFGHVPKLLTAEAGEDIALSCFPPEGNPRPTVSWMKGGEILNLQSGKYSVDSLGVLRVTRLEAADSGKYQCVASNEAGLMKDSPVTLKISQVEERENIVEKERLEVPVISEAVLLDKLTGLVQWLPVFQSRGYVVRVTVGVNRVEITNISVEADVNQVKLHSLDPDLRYFVSLASQRGEDISQFSPAHELVANSKEVSVNIMETKTEEDIPTSVWVVGMVVVSLITLIIITSAVVIFHKIATQREKDIVTVVEQQLAGTEKYARYSWMDRRAWNSSSQVTSFKSGSLLLDNNYDYVVHSQKSEAYQVPEAEGMMAPPSGTIYHYAASPIVKKEYLMPIYQPKI